LTLLGFEGDCEQKTKRCQQDWIGKVTMTEIDARFVVQDTKHGRLVGHDKNRHIAQSQLHGRADLEGQGDWKC